MNMSFFAFAVMAVAIRAFNNARGALGVMMAMAGLRSVEEVADDDKHGEDEEGEALHDDGLRF
jgi:hypothetical protein